MASHIDIGDVVGQYEITDILGAGGMATVYRGVHRSGLGMVAAIKVLHAHYARNIEIVERLRVEARALARLQHPNIVQIFDFIDNDGQCAIITELVDGRSLRAILKDDPSTPLDPNRALELFVQIVQGMEHAHAKSCLHRDLKPDNLMVTVEGRIKILDFGIASLIDTDRITTTGRAFGTPAYMAPEQFEGMELVDERSDIYSLGVTLWEMLAGAGARPKGVPIWRLGLRDIDMLHERDVPVDFLDLIKVMVVKPQQERIGSCSELLDALAVIVQDRYDTGQLEGYEPSQMMLSPEEIEDTSPLQDSPGRAAMGAAQPKTVAGATHLFRTLTRRLPNQGEARAGPAGLRVTNIHPRATSFVGREDELSAMAGLFQQGARLVTLLGPAGTGKTRLAQVFASERVQDYPGGVWFCDLATAKADDAMLSSVASVLEVPLGAKDPEGGLVQTLNGRGPTLLVLDHLEQIASGTGRVLSKLMSDAPDTWFIATSRSPLKIEGEQQLPVGPLTLPSSQDPQVEAVEDNPAVRLFVDRARAVKHDFQLDATNVGDIVQLVHELDGLPLAVELAAARIKVLTPSMILQRLGRRFDLLRSAPSSQGDQATTLYGSLDGSWDLLNPWERAALVQLAVLAGSFFLEAAEAVIDLSDWHDAPWALDVIQALADHSLLRVLPPDEEVGQPRYELLRSVRAYTREKLDRDPQTASDLGQGGAGASQTAEERHSAYFCSFGQPQFIDSLDAPGGLARRQILRRSQADLRVTIERALAGRDATAAALALCALHEVERFGGYSAGLLSLCAQVLAHDQLAGPQRVRVLVLRGRLQRLVGQPDAAHADLQAAMELARDNGDTSNEGMVVYALAALARNRGRAHEAQAGYREALKLHRQIGARRREAATLGDLASLLWRQGELEEARALYQQALVLHRDVGHRRAEGIHLAELASLERARGELDAAKSHYETALQIHRELGAKRSEGLVLTNLGLLHHQEGRLDQARATFEQALAIGREMGNRPNEAVVLGNLGDLALDAGDLEAARSHLTEALALCRDIGLRVGEGAFLGSMAVLCAREGRTDDARAHLQAGEDILRDTGNDLELAKLLCRRGQLEGLVGSKVTAQATLVEAQSVAQRLGAGPDSELGRSLADLRAVLAAGAPPQDEAEAETELG
ncbi:MAG TPA: hypothetical protein DIU15_09710 [Deltaproteobacteria bacterium]|nr:hypothetical protein [Deltaproteobacteria bacterium]HCP46307.1 hypothetical protein [Deltaproteobacteria bacterium]